MQCSELTQLEYVLPRVGLAVCSVGLLVLYAIYYYVFVVGPPRVVCCDAGKLRALRSHCPALFENYWPTVWATQAHVQTVLRELTQTTPRQKGKRRREVLRLKDGGHVCLDWYNELEGEQVDTDRPTILMLPGMTGSSEETYIQHWVDDVTKLGYRSVVFNYRGCGNTKLSTPRLYCLGDVGDLTEVVDHIHTTLPHSPLIGIGTSMGSIQLLTYIIEQKRQQKLCHLRAVLVFSVIWDIKKTDEILHQNSFNKHILSRFLTVRYKSIMKQNRAVFHESRERGELNFDYEAAMKSNNLRDLRDTVILNMFEYKDHHHIHENTSPSLRAHDLSIPVLAVNSVDDPFCPPHAIPEAVAKDNHNLMLATTRRGGHIAFLKGILPFRKNFMDTVITQFLRAVLHHNSSITTQV